MRTDIKIINRSIRLNYDKVLKRGRYKLEAKRGDILGFKNYNGEVSIGRMIGRIVDDLEFSKSQNENCTGYACCVVLSQDHSFVMERWIKPDEILFCYDPNQELFGKEHIQQMYNNFFGEEFKSIDADTLRHWGATGYSKWTNKNE